MYVFICINCFICSRAILYEKFFVHKTQELYLNIYYKSFVQTFFCQREQQ